MLYKTCRLFIGWYTYLHTEMLPYAPTYGLAASLLLWVVLLLALSLLLVLLEAVPDATLLKGKQRPEQLHEHEQMLQVQAQLKASTLYSNALRFLLSFFIISPPFFIEFSRKLHCQK